MTAVATSDVRFVLHVLFLSSFFPTHSLHSILLLKHFALVLSPLTFPPFLCLFPRRKWLAEKLNAFGLVLERSQLLQVSKLARAWYFLKKQGRGAVSYFTFSAVAMDTYKWLSATQKGSRGLPASLAAVCFVLRSIIAPDHLNQLQLQHKERITLHFSPSKRSTSSFLELTPGSSQPSLQSHIMQLLHPKSYKVHVDLILFQLIAPLNLCIGLWAPFSLWRLRGPERGQTSRAQGSLKKDPVSREEYDYEQHSGNMVLGVCSQAIME